MIRGAGRLAMAVVACAAALAAPRALPADRPVLAPVAIVAPHYGDMLFHLYQRNWFEAIVRNEAYQSAGLLGPHAADAELALAGLYLGFGQYDRARATFDRLLADSSTPQPVRDRAWFQLGKDFHTRGRYEDSLDALRRIGGPLPPDTEAEHTILYAQDLIALGRYDEAAARLVNWSGPDEWRSFGRFNLGIALVRGNRLDQGLAVLEGIGTADAVTEEMESLRDKANVAIGYACLQAGRADCARAALERVRLAGPQANKALLGAGWAAAADERYQDALAPWTALRSRSLLDSTVQESYLAVPFAYAKLGAGQQAAVSYEAAIAAFEGERRRLQESIGAIRSGAMLEALVALEPDSGTGEFAALSTLPDSPESRYLYHLLASHEFQEALKDYRSLGFLDANVAGWSDGLAALGALVESRAKALAVIVPVATARRDAADLGGLLERRVELGAWLDRARTQQDGSLLAEGDEQRQLAALAGVESALSARGADPTLSDARDTLRLERGVLQWRLEAESKERAWRAGNSLRGLDRQLAEATARKTALDAALTAVPARNAAAGDRIAELQPRLATLSQGIRAARQRQGEFLASLAISQLEVQQARLADYTAQARYALAALYDRGAPTSARDGEGRAP